MLVSLELSVVVLYLSVAVASAVVTVSGRLLVLASAVLGACAPVVGSALVGLCVLMTTVLMSVLKASAVLDCSMVLGSRVVSIAAVEGGPSVVVYSIGIEFWVDLSRLYFQIK